MYNIESVNKHADVEVVAGAEMWRSRLRIRCIVRLAALWIDDFKKMLADECWWGMDAVCPRSGGLALFRETFIQQLKAVGDRLMYNTNNLGLKKITSLSKMRQYLVPTF